ncbi:MAG: hypothetical protein ACOX5T_09860 [Candidatus Cryptobacteroides sp.]|jgi:hypothetical protein
MEKDWLNSLRKRMEDYEESAPEGLWNDIASAVPDRAPKRGRALPVLWLWRSVAAAAVVAFGVFAGVRLFSPDDDSGRIAQVRRNVADTAALADPGAPFETISDLSVTDLQESPASLLQSSSPSSVNKLGRRTSSAENRPYAPDLLAQANIPAQADPSGVVPLTDQTQVAVAEQRGDAQPQPEDSRPLVPGEIANSHEGEDWSGYASASMDGPDGTLLPDHVGIGISGGTVDTRHSSSYNPMMFYRGAAPHSKNDPVKDGQGEGHVSVVTRATGMPPATVTDRVDHKRPIRAGISLRWQLNDTFGVESGIEYSILKSTFSTLAGTTLSEDFQTLQYLGIPLDLTADLLDTRYFSLYASVGGMVEKGIAGNVKSAISVDGERVGPMEEHSLRIDPLLWSVNAAAGLQVNATRLVGFYAEPGISYRFDNGSEVSSIYTSRPLDFTLSFGLRFSFR